MLLITLAKRADLGIMMFSVTSTCLYAFGVYEAVCSFAGIDLFCCEEALCYLPVMRRSGLRRGGNHARVIALQRQYRKTKVEATSRVWVSRGSNAQCFCAELSPPLTVVLRRHTPYSGECDARDQRLRCLY